MYKCLRSTLNVVMSKMEITIDIYINTFNALVTAKSVLIPRPTTVSVNL